MRFPTAISFHGLATSEPLRAEVIERVLQLEHSLDDILACRVVVEADSRWLRQGSHYGVHVRVAMPCYEVEAGGRPASDARHEDPYLTIADTFDALGARLHDFIRRRCANCERHVAARRPGRAI